MGTAFAPQLALAGMSKDDFEMELEVKNATTYITTTGPLPSKGNVLPVKCLIENLLFIQPILEWHMKLFEALSQT